MADKPEQQPAAPAPAAAQPATGQQQQQQQGGEQGSGSEEKKKSPPPQPLTENPMLWALGAGMLGLLFSGGGGIGAFLLAGVMALVAAFAGPKLMKHFSGDDENQLPTLAALDKKDGQENQKFKVKLLDKNSDSIIDKSEQEGVAASDQASLKAALETASKQQGSGITPTEGGKFNYTDANTELTLTAPAPTTPAPTTNPAAAHGAASPSH